MDIYINALVKGLENPRWVIVLATAFSDSTKLLRRFAVLVHLDLRRTGKSCILL